MKPTLTAMTLPGLLDAGAEQIPAQSPTRFVAPIQALHNGCPLCGGHTEQDECADGLYRRLCTYSEHHDTGFAQCPWEGELLADSRDAYYDKQQQERDARLLAKYGTTDTAQINHQIEAGYARFMTGATGAAMLLDSLRGASLTA